MSLFNGFIETLIGLFLCITLKNNYKYIFQKFILLTLKI